MASPGASGASSRAHYQSCQAGAAVTGACRKEAVQCWHRTTAPPKAQDGTGDNHAISAAKFEILSDFLALGWGVLLSDVDVLTVSNPFEKLHRDHDVEGMSDGFDDCWAYGMIDGFDDPSMGWAR